MDASASVAATGYAFAATAAFAAISANAAAE
jgi:hypothetical protein